MATHLVLFVGYIVPMAATIGSIAFWLIARDQHPHIDQHGREAVNFRISMFLWYLGSVFLLILIIGFFLLIALAIFELVVTIVASVKAQQGESFHYPLCVRFLPSSPE